MFRTSLEVDAPQMSVFSYPDNTGGGATWRGNIRPRSTAYDEIFDTPPTSIFMKISRIGDRVTTYFSTDNVNFSPIQTKHFPVDGIYFLGISSASMNSGLDNVATFRGLQVFDNPNDSSGGNEALYRVNAGGPEVAAIDGGAAWLGDTSDNNSIYLVNAGSNTTSTFTDLDAGPTVGPFVPEAIFDTCLLYTSPSPRD